MTKLAPELQSVKGMPDGLPDRTPLWQYMESTIRRLMAGYGYEEIRMPLLEKTALFQRSIGEVTDIVEKEMFTLMDRGERSLSLRPEGTAGCVRACLEHSLIRNQQQQRLWYLGPMFRYEEPQEGRYRQFHQFGAESFSLSGFEVELEHILMLSRFWKQLGLADCVQLEINSLGNPETREAYLKAVVQHFTAHHEALDADSQRRLKTNPLRILDSKNPALQALIQQAPPILDFLDEDSKTHFQGFREALEAAGIAYTINTRLVRGLDYYNRTIYEWTTDRLGSQSAVCGGGRYDRLVAQLGGEPTPAAGFAVGLERVLLLLEKQQKVLDPALDGYLITVGAAAECQNMRLAEKIRDALPDFRLRTHCGGGGFKNQFKKADKSGASVVFVVGDDEMAAESVSVKFLRDDRPQVQVKLQDLSAFLGGLHGNVLSH